MKRVGFTIIEFLIVIAIVGIIGVVVVLVLNPTEISRQGRDSARISNLNSLDLAVTTYSANSHGGSLGVAQTLYISIPDRTATSTAGDQCQGLGLPALPSGWAYHCAASSTYLKIDGTGWLPINFASISVPSVSILPVDPVNTTTTGLYYAYSTDGGSQYTFTGLMESSKQRAALKTKPTLDSYPGADILGTSLALSPLYSPTGLLDYWKLDDGAGSSTIDSAGTLTGPLAGGLTWTTGNIGGALSFDGSTGNVNFGNVPSLGGMSAITLSSWVKTTSVGEGHILDKSQCSGDPNTGSWELTYGGGGFVGIPIGGIYPPNNPGYDTYNSSGKKINDGNWHLITETWDNVNLNLYADGVLQNVFPVINFGMYAGTQAVDLGGYCNGGPYYTPETLDDVRIYNRALSAAEVLALYNAQR